MWVLILLVLLLAPLPLQAAPTPLVLLSANSNSYLEVSEALKNYGLREAEVQILDATNSLTLADRTVIAVGSRACQKSVKSATADTRLICTFLPSNSYSRIAKLAHTQRLRKAGNITALYLDQPLSRQMQLGLLIKPDARSIGTLLGNNDDKQAENFTRTAKKLGLTARIAHLSATDNPVSVLGPVIEESDLFLPLPGHSTAVSGASKWILYLTLRNGVPLIGYSKGYADAGAVIALYSSVNQIARETVRLERMTETGLPLPPPHYPRNFELSINTIAARNLGIDLPSRDVLQHRLGESEQQP